MFESIQPLAADPILGLMALFREDTNPNKVDLGVGVYRNEQGQTPVLAAVKEAEARVIRSQCTKAYVGPAGNEAFNQAMATLLLGQNSACLEDGCATFVQTPGGCGALRVAAELLKANKPDTTIWVSDPTWGNHIPLLGNSGLNIRTYPYYDPNTNGLKTDAMLDALAQVPKGDVVLLHGCCHNPTGVDLGMEHWQAIAALAQKQGFTPFVDMAYQGFAEAVEADAEGLRYLCRQLDEVLIAASCSKNFGLYRERVGVVGVVGANATTASAIKTHILTIVRGIYSMPPDHGAAIVTTLLEDEALKSLWLEEVGQMRDRIQTMRTLFSELMRKELGSSRFDFVAVQKGMFSFLGITPYEVGALADRFGIYMLESSRASIAGLNHNSINYVCHGIAEVCRNSQPND